MLGRNVFNAVRFVEYHVIVRRQELNTLVAQRQVRKEQRMVADQQVTVLHAPPRGLIETLAIGWALSSHAVVRV